MNHICLYRIVTKQDICEINSDYLQNSQIAINGIKENGRTKLFLTHLFGEVVEAFVVLGLCDCFLFEEGVQERLLLEIELVAGTLLLLIGR